ncbi:unnamed protein product [Acanthoscelides obtectus]|uniref:Uncharacterized protein n=1 Tax=Acanthoscelides obtectus TaxID=200917 RepID=A0A9P0P894_ACAOB|nr:unnamed protein product [Acanthoscelides obtectus]CAK1680217.1 hypothetical protein AOBTE_LOCUS32535 [Acanthoscelides obtectus]
MEDPNKMVSPSPKDNNVGEDEDPTDLDIIRLQLRKPKSWNWQLTTSKSSPHVSLPTVQLLDYKGRLLVEAHDGWNVQSKVWKSGDPRKHYHLKKSRSDSTATSTLSTLNKHLEQMKRDSDVKTRKELPTMAPLTKCNSEMIGNRIGLNGCHPGGLVRNASAPACRENRHQRSRSDDLFLRRLKHSSEESIRRAEMDGYRRFIKPHLSVSQKEPDLQPKVKPRRRNGLMQTTEGGSFNGKALQPEMTELHHKRYTTRTSSAGTLVIEESFLKPTHRRRRRTVELEVPREEHELRGRSYGSTSSQPKAVKSGLFHSHSEVFPFERVLASKKVGKPSERVNGIQHSTRESEAPQQTHRRGSKTRRSCSSDSLVLKERIEGRGRISGNALCRLFALLS